MMMHGLASVKLLNCAFASDYIVPDFDFLSVLWVAYATHSTLKPVPTLRR